MIKIQTVKSIKILILAAICGVLAGCASSLFLFLLNWATSFRQWNPSIIFALPMIGFLISLVYLKFGKKTDVGSALIFQELHQPVSRIPFRLAPLVLLGTVLTHLFGGSAGREGTAVQMSGAFADQVAHLFKVNIRDRRALLICGMSAGFGSVIGAPLAGVMFGIEVLSVGTLQIFALVEAMLASLISVGTVRAIGVAHTIYPIPQIPSFSSHVLFAVCVSGLAFGLSAQLFLILCRWVERIAKKIVYSPLRTFTFGCVILVGYWLEGSFRYCGLGLSIIQESLSTSVSLRDPFFKALFTALTIGSGYKGGEFIPLVFIGSTLGNIVGNILQVGGGFLASLGFASMFGAASNTPLACTILLGEIFGWQFAPYGLISCCISYYCTSGEGIYKNQSVHRNKHAVILRMIEILRRRK